jgi:hypothetical protein
MHFFNFDNKKKINEKHFKQKLIIIMKAISIKKIKNYELIISMEEHEKKSKQ